MSLFRTYSEKKLQILSQLTTIKFLIFNPKIPPKLLDQFREPWEQQLLPGLVIEKYLGLFKNNASFLF